MRSPLVEEADYIPDPERYSDLQVLRSGAGYYVGTVYNHPEGYQEPGSRDSEYFPSHDAASKVLEELESGVGLDRLRMNP